VQRERLVTADWRPPGLRGRINPTGLFSPRSVLAGRQSGECRLKGLLDQASPFLVGLLEADDELGRPWLAAQARAAPPSVVVGLHPSAREALADPVNALSMILRRASDRPARLGSSGTCRLSMPGAPLKLALISRSSRASIRTSVRPSVFAALWIEAG
jgi:hypothetical protein